MNGPHPLIRSSAPSTQDRGASRSGECQRCDACYTKLYGCTSACYCHRGHPLEPGGIE